MSIKLAELDYRLTPTIGLRPGDAFTTDAGNGVLFFVEQPCTLHGTRRHLGDPLRALDMTGKLHTVHAGACVRVLLDIDTLPHCETCEHGCYCTAGSGGCEHFGCWGAGARDASCIGALRQRIELWSRVAPRYAR